MNKSRIFLISSLSFIAGIFTRSFFILNFGAAKFLLLILAIIIGATFFKNRKALALSGAVLFFALGIWRTDSSLNKFNVTPLDGKDFSGNVIVVREPEQKDNYQNVVAELARPMPQSRVLINANKYLPVEYGDELKISCTLKIPATGSLANTREETQSFDYRMYLAKDGIYYLCQNAQVERIGSGRGSGIYGAILKLKNKMEANINQVIPQPESALANGLILGGSSRMSKLMQNNFSKTGTTHIVAVSGYNVTIIAEYLVALGLILGLWRPRAFWFAVFGIIFFVAMTGFPSSAVRAGVMGTLLIWAAKNGRLANSWNAIIAAAAVMLLVNPLSLRWDIGFQLSFLATIGIVSLAPFWENRLIKKHKAFGITETAFLTISAQIFVLPVIFYNFHIFSIVSVLANVLILPVIPISMFLVFLASVAGFLGNLFSLPFAWLSYLLLKYETAVINLLSGLKWSSMEVKNFPVWAMIFWYLFLTAAILFFKKWQKRKVAEIAKSRPE